MGCRADAEELHSLFELVADTDEFTRGIVTDRVLDIGWDAIAYFYSLLGSAEGRKAGPAVRKSVREMSMCLSHVEVAGLLAEGDYFNVPDGMYYITRIIMPELSPEKFRSSWLSAGNDLACGIRDSMTAVEKIEFLNYIVYDKYGIRIRKDFPEGNGGKGFLIPYIMENREAGIAGMASLYILLANYAGLPVYPVFTQIPGFFISCLEGGKALFTIDVGNKGSISEPIPAQFWKRTGAMGTDRTILYFYAASLRRYCFPAPAMALRILDRLIGMLRV